MIEVVGDGFLMNGGGNSNHIIFQNNGSGDSALGFFPGGSGDDTIDAFG
jgi:hypothetical protein